LKLRFEAELAMKEENTTLWYGNQSFTLQLNMAIQMLYAIEVYASKCYDNTQKHLANVEKLETLEEIIEYDYHTGYPEKLEF
jgi:phage tail sheath gpL-like